MDYHFFLPSMDSDKMQNVMKDCNCRLKVVSKNVFILIYNYGSMCLGGHPPMTQCIHPDVTASPPSPLTFTARAAALDTDFDLFFLRVRPLAGELDSVQLVGGGALLKKG